MKAVFIGNDQVVKEMVSASLRLRWPDTKLQIAGTAADRLELVERISPDVVLLHPDFEDMSLSESIQALRDISNVPLLALGRQNNEMELIAALETGADDYVRLPCDMTEIMLRVYSLLRRTGFSERNDGLNSGKETPIQSGPLQINPSTYEVFLDGQRLHLSSTEFRLLHLLASNPRVVVNHDTIVTKLWDSQSDVGLLKKYIQRLRHKLGDDSRAPRWIASVHGVGYRFIGPPSSQAETAQKKKMAV